MPSKYASTTTTIKCTYLLALNYVINLFLYLPFKIFYLCLFSLITLQNLNTFDTSIIKSLYSIPMLLITYKHPYLFTYIILFILRFLAIYQDILLFLIYLYYYI